MVGSPLVQTPGLDPTLLKQKYIIIQVQYVSTYSIMYVTATSLSTAAMVSKFYKSKYYC